MDEFNPALEHMNKSLELFEDLPSSVQYKHADTIIDVCNQLAVVLQGKDKTEKALEHLKKAEAYYKAEAPQDAMEPDLIAEDWLRGTREKLEANLTQTYFYYAQVYSKIGRGDEGIEFSAKTMQR